MQKKLYYISEVKGLGTVDIVDTLQIRGWNWPKARRNRTTCRCCGFPIFIGEPYFSVKIEEEVNHICLDCCSFERIDQFLDHGKPKTLNK